jgi:AsmA family protein
MRRIALIVLGAAAGLVALVLIGVAIAVATVDPNRFVAPLAARVQAETGRELTVQGPVQFKVSLEPRIVLPGVAFQSAPWSKTPDMVTAKRIEAQFALLPLLSRRFEVIQFTLVEPVITLETDARGRGNWEFGTPTAQTPAAGATAGAATAIGIGSFEIRQGTLTYRNGATGKVTHASIERMTMHARDLSAPVAVDFRGRIDEIPVALNGDLGPPSQWLAQRWPYPVALKGEVDGTDVKVTTKLGKAGTTTTFDDLAINYGPIAATGRVRSTGDGDNTRYAIELAIPSLSLADLPGKPAPAKGSAGPVPGGGTAPASSTAAASGAGQWVVPDTPLPLGVLAAVEGEGSLAIGTLKLRDGQQLSRVGAQIASRDSKVDLKFSAESILGGSMRGELQVDAQRSDAPGVRLQLNAQQLDLPKLAAAAGVRREIRGGKVRADIDITGRGATPHRVASTMSGTILVVSGPATLVRSTVQEESAVSQIAGALDPFRTVDAATELRCAVFRLALKDGIAHVDRGIAVETGKIAGSASGTLNFRDETLDLSVQPQIRQGVKIDVSEFASLVRIRGRFDKPSVALDAVQSAQMLAKLGVLGSKGGGLEALGRALIAPGTESAAAPCSVAMSGKAPRDAPPPSASQERTPARTPDLGLPEDVGRALGNLLRR